jgi:hypothetical protein
MVGATFATIVTAAKLSDHHQQVKVPTTHVYIVTSRSNADPMSHKSCPRPRVKNLVAAS